MKYSYYPKFVFLTFRYIFYTSGGSSVMRINLIGTDRKQFQVKVDDFLLHLDYVNQQLFYGNHESNKIYSMDYDGGFFKNTSVIKIGALVFFGDFLYSQENKSLVIQEKNVSSGLVYRNISLPRPIFHLKDLVVMEQSLYPTGEMTRLAYNYRQNFGFRNHYHHHTQAHNN